MWASLGRTTIAVIAVLALGFSATPPARADGDPASDVLLGENVFYPYTPPVSASLQGELNGLTTRLAHGGLHLKVALIASPVDLGVIPDLFGHPQSYANFLDQEISFQGPQPLLVVMAAGYGVKGLPARARALAATLPRPSGGSSDALAVAAIEAVTKLSSASGLRVTPASSPPGAAGGGSSALIVVLAVLAAIVALVLAALTLGRPRIRLRRRRPPG